MFSWWIVGLNVYRIMKGKNMHFKDYVECNEKLPLKLKIAEDIFEDINNGSVSEEDGGYKVNIPLL